MSENLIPEKGPGWRVGKCFYPILRDAQAAAISALLNVDTLGQIPDAILDHQEEVIKILSLGKDEPKPRKRRKDAGTHRTQKSVLNPTAIAQ